MCTNCVMFVHDEMVPDLDNGTITFIGGKHRITVSVADDDGIVSVVGVDKHRIFMVPLADDGQLRLVSVVGIDDLRVGSVDKVPAGDDQRFPRAWNILFGKVDK